MQDRARSVRSAAIVVSALLAVSVAGAAPEAAQRWEVTLAVRLTDGGGKPVHARLALPPETPTQRLLGVDIAARGFTTTVVREGDAPHVLLEGRFKDARRVAVTFQVERRREQVTVPPVAGVAALGPELLPYVSPAPLFQSRSILVREFLETYATPRLQAGTIDPLRAIFEVTRQELEPSPDGKSLALDVIRRRSGKQIGIERAFTTFLRCARVPARFVEGIRLTSRARRKRVFWTEVWADGRWWPVSASQGRVGNLPTSYLALARDGTRVLQVDGAATAVYSVRTRRVESGS